MRGRVALFKAEQQRQQQQAAQQQAAAQPAATSDDDDDFPEVMRHLAACFLRFGCVSLMAHPSLHDVFRCCRRSCCVTLWGWTCLKRRQYSVMRSRLLLLPGCDVLSCVFRYPWRSCWTTSRGWTCQKRTMQPRRPASQPAPRARTRQTKAASRTWKLDTWQPEIGGAAGTCAGQALQRGHGSGSRPPGQRRRQARGREQQPAGQ